MKERNNLPGPKKEGKLQPGSNKKLSLIFVGIVINLPG
jgi:hypothetical protein